MADDAERSDACACPGCLDAVILKRGRIKIAHFAHLPSAVCDYGSGETEAHYAAKLKLHAVLLAKGLRAEVEYVIGDQRADVMAWTASGEPMAFELQHTSIGLPEIEARVHGYARLGIAQLWIPFLAKRDTERFPVRRFELFVSDLCFNRMWFWSEEEQAFVFAQFGAFFIDVEQTDWGGGYSYPSKRWRQLKVVGFCDPALLKFSVRYRQARSYGSFRVPHCRLIEVDVA